MTAYEFSISGKINTEMLDDAMDIIKIILEDNGIKVNHITICSKDRMVTEKICSKT